MKPLIAMFFGFGPPLAAGQRGDPTEMVRNTVLRTGCLAATLTLSLAAQQPAAGTAAAGNDASQRQAQGNQVGNPNPQSAPATNPGPGQQVPNQALSGSTPATNSSLQGNPSGSMGIDLGWVGLFGLAGLFGLRRGSGSLERAEGYSPRNRTETSRT